MTVLLHLIEQKFYSLKTVICQYLSEFTDLQSMLRCLMKYIYLLYLEIYNAI